VNELPRDPPWVAEARRHIGTREIPGPRHEPKILQWWRAIKRGGIKDDETPWCAAFVGGCLEVVGIVSTRFEGARSYLQWGKRLDTAEYGAIAVLGRAGGGHVAFVVGRDSFDRIMLLGGNQNNAVNIAAFPTTRVLGYRWPEPVPMPERRPLPLMRAAASTSEA
jgi:uncharacterized protein (TIGR02594 family)